MSRLTGMLSTTTAPAGYLRYPDLHDDQVVFCAADDIWIGPTAGGVAWRLTADSVPVKQPRFAPDGSTVAWISTRDGHPEVFVIPVEGGESRRLTYWGSGNTSLLGWTADGRVLAATSAGEANLRHAVVKAVALDGTVERLAYGPASAVAVHPGGAVALATPFSRPPAWWKRYRGGTASRLWLDRSGAGAWERLLPDETAGLDSPIWVGDRLVFASDRAAAFPDRADEQANLWALDVHGDGSLTQLTRHTAAEGYVRDPRSDGERIVYHAHGRIHLMAGPDATPVPLDLRLGGTVPGRRRRLLDPEHHLDAVLPDHDANASIVAWRGKAFHLTHREGPARALRADSAIRVREPHLLGRTGRAIWVSDAAAAEAGSATVGSVDRLEAVAIGSGDEPEVVVAGGLGRVLHLRPSPAGDRAAVVSHDGRVSLVDVATGAVRTVGRSDEGEATGPVFSPDGRYLVWSQPVDATEHRQLVLARTDGTDQDTADAAVPLTSGRFDDFCPAFSQDGTYLMFLSKRTFDPTYDAHVFNLMFTSATRPYLVPLSAEEESPFGPSLAGRRVGPEPDDKGKGADEAAAGNVGAGASGPEQPGPDLEVEGFEDRVVAFPVPSGDYRALQPAKDGAVWIHESAEQGALGTAHAGIDEEPADVVEYYSFPKRSVEAVVDKADAVAVAAGGERMVVRAGADVTVLPVVKSVKPDDPDHVTVDLSRLRFELDPVAEWRQMFDENARIMADHFWREDMDGVDWAGVIERYRPLVERVGSTDDLVDVLWETVGELNTSHAYVQPSDPPGDQRRRLGLLGADLARTEDGWRIERILPGESSDPDARSPLRAAGVGAQPGDVVVAVGGAPVDPLLGPAPALQGAAGQPVELTLRRPGATGGDTTRRVVVVPVPDEETLRYQDWVRGRAAYVAEHSGGRLGYVHIPDMMGLGWAQLHRDLHVATAAEGLVVDVRYNRGGHTSQLVIERLARRVVGWDRARHHRQDSSYPENAPRGPVVFVANEFSGSDGDIINAAAQALGVGPVIGVRTWGGVVGIDGRFDLVDGTGITQPRYAFWFRHLGWAVENHGVDPDIEVPHSPADFFASHDPQLDRAIAEALARLEREPAAAPPHLPAPKVRPTD